MYFQLLRERRCPVRKDHGQHRARPPSPGGRWSRARACWSSAGDTVSIMLHQDTRGQGGTYVVPDGHDEHHGHAQGGVELRKAADLGEAVAVVESLELVGAELGGDVTSVRDALDGGGRGQNLLAVLDEELGESAGLELRDDGELLAGVDLKALAVKVGVPHAVRVVVAAVGVAATGEAVLRVGAAASVGLADVVLVVLASVGGEGVGIRVGLPVSC